MQQSYQTVDCSKSHAGTAPPDNNIVLQQWSSHLNEAIPKTSILAALYTCHSVDVLNTMYKM